MALKNVQGGGGVLNHDGPNRQPRPLANGEMMVRGERKRQFEASPGVECRETNRKRRPTANSVTFPATSFFENVVSEGIPKDGTSDSQSIKEPDAPKLGRAMGKLREEATQERALIHGHLLNVVVARRPILKLMEPFGGYVGSASRSSFALSRHRQTVFVPTSSLDRRT